MIDLGLSKIKFRGDSPFIEARRIYLGLNKIYDVRESDYRKEYFTIESLVDNNTVTLTKSTYAPEFYIVGNKNNYGGDPVNDWSYIISDTTSITLDKGEKLYLCSDATSWSNQDASNFDALQNWKIGATGYYKVYGNLASLMYIHGFDDKTSFRERSANYNYYEGRQFAGLFFGSTTLLDAQNLVMPFTTLDTECYYGMFAGCSHLHDGPELLPATTLEKSCYEFMFDGSGIVSSPILPAATLVEKCYKQMFYEASLLQWITCLATDISATDATTNWVNFVYYTGTFRKAANMSSWSSGVNGIPAGWTVVDYGSSPQPQTYECPECGGNGTVYGDFTCPECSGSGEIWDEDSEEYITCPECNGNGQVTGTYECPECNGTGEVSFEWEECPECNGSGQVTCVTCNGSGWEECGACGGTGYVTDDETGDEVECPDCGGNGGFECPDCGGNGYVTCPTCDGAGWEVCGGD